MQALSPDLMVMPDISELIAHRDNMLLIDRVLVADEAECVAEYTPQAAAWYADAVGNMPAWIGIELMAQAVAAYVGAEKRRRGWPPKQGMLLGTRSYKSECPFFAAGEALHIRAEVAFRSDDGLGAFECQLMRASEPQHIVASAVLKVFEPDDFQAFLDGVKQ